MDGYYAETIAKLGYEPISFFSDSAEMKLFKKTFWMKYENIFRRFFFKDNSYLDRCYKNHVAKSLTKKIEEIAKKHPRIAYSLFFRADYYPDEVLEIARKISGKMITYQFDGMSISQNLIPNISIFDRIFTFDTQDWRDYKKYQFLPITNNWFPDAERNNEILQEYIFFYIGVGTPERILNMEKFKNIADKNDWNLSITLTVSPHIAEKNENGFSVSSKGMTYPENIQNLKKAKVLIDMKLPYHNGLSYRFFEALYYNKKMITNNEMVKQYDFYHPSNIFITDYNNFDGIEDFIKKPYHPIDPNIIEKYGAENWLKYILDLPDHQKINLP